MATPRTRWRPLPPPGNIIKAERVVDGVAEVALVAYIAETERRGDKLHVRCESAEGLLQGMPLPFDPPRIATAADPDGFRYWWRQIHYAFELPDPALIPPLPQPLAGLVAEIVERFVKTAHDLASAQVMSDQGGVSVAIDDHTDVEHVIADFPQRDIQIGFTTLLRQCHGPTDEARFDLVVSALHSAAAAATDADRADRLQQLDAWKTAVVGLKKRSLDQRVRDRYVTEEGWKVWDYQEVTEPAELIRILNYGDLIHWGRTRASVTSSNDDEYGAAMQRTDFFKAALGLAHITVGFAELARALTTPRGAIWLPA